MSDKEVKKRYEELLKSLDVSEAFLDWYHEFELLGEVFPAIYLPGEEIPKRIGWSGEEI